MRSTVAIGSLAAVSAFTASLSHSIEKPCTSDHAANAALSGSALACGSDSVPTPRASSAAAAASAATRSGSASSNSDARMPHPPKSMNSRLGVRTAEEVVYLAAAIMVAVGGS